MHLFAIAGGGDGEGLYITSAIEQIDATNW